MGLVALLIGFCVLWTMNKFSDEGNDFMVWICGLGGTGVLVILHALTT